jgi:hypothetical protein
MWQRLDSDLQTFGEEGVKSIDPKLVRGLMRYIKMSECGHCPRQLESRRQYAQMV